MNILLYTLIASIYTFTLNTLGSGIVFLFKKVNKNIMDGMLCISSGIMIAASFFSLLNPAMSLAANIGQNVAITLTIGITLGGIFLYLSGIFFEHKLSKKGNKLSIKRCIMLFLSITIHNIPEGMVIGVAFASTTLNIKGATIASAIILTIGIGIQNFPEGSAISLPLRREGMTRLKAFLFGMLSGTVEIISAFIGALLVLKIQILLPYLLSLAAGAMIYVVTSQLIPEALTNKNKDLMSLLTILGFTIMMILDITLG